MTGEPPSILGNSLHPAEIADMLHGMGRERAAPERHNPFVRRALKTISRRQNRLERRKIRQEWQEMDTE